MTDTGNCRTLPDYHDIFNAGDLRHPPQLNEYEFNPFLLFDDICRELHMYEIQHGIVNMSTHVMIQLAATAVADKALDYGFLTAISGRLRSANSTALVQKLEEQAKQQTVSTADLLLSWAYYRLNGIVVTSSSNKERLKRTFGLLSAPSAPVDGGVYSEMEKAAERDGSHGKRFYGHPHMEKARLETELATNSQS